MRSFLALKFLPYPREKYTLKLNKISTVFSTHSPHDNSFLRFKYPLLNEKVSRLSELNSLYTKSWHNHSGSSMKYHHLISFVIAFGRDNFLELDVYFEEMQVTLITQRQAYDQESLFGECDLRCMQTDSHWLPSPISFLFFFTSYFHLRLSFFPSGDIGGQVGLFLGASILTVLEFCDLLARIVVNKYKQRKRQRSRTV